jgi:hypothetical protein
MDLTVTLLAPEGSKIKATSANHLFQIFANFNIEEVNLEEKDIAFGCGSKTDAVSLYKSANGIHLNGERLNFKPLTGILYFFACFLSYSVTTTIL